MDTNLTAPNFLKIVEKSFNLIISSNDEFQIKIMNNLLHSFQDIELYFFKR